MRSTIQILFISFFIVISNIYTSVSQTLPESVQRMEDSLLNSLTIAKNDTVKVKRLYRLSQKMYEHDYVKALKYCNQSIELSKRLDYIKGEAKGHFLKGIIFYFMSNHDSSLEELFAAIKLNDKIKSIELYALIYNFIGINYKVVKNHEKARFYYEKSLEYHTLRKSTRGIEDLNTNIGLLLFDQGQYDLALEYFNRGLPTDKSSPSHIANAILNFINVYLKKEQYEVAYNKLLYIDSFKKDIGSFRVLTEFYYLFGVYYKATDDYDNAILYFNKCIKIGQEKYFWDYVKTSFEELGEIYQEQHNYKQSLESYKGYTLAKDSLLTLETQKRITQLELKNDYDEYLAKIELLKEQKKIGYLLYGALSFLFCLLIIFLYYRQKKKIKLNKKEYQLTKELFENKLQHSTLEKIQLKYELDYREKELDFKNNELVGFALQIIQNNDFVEQIRKKLKVIVGKLRKEENLKLIEELDYFIRRTINLEKSRKEFYTKTKDLHKTFLHKLNIEYPNISSKEKELALLLRLGYSSKDISVLLNISPKSVDMARYRLRKKLDIPAQTSLKDFFGSVKN